MKMLEHLGLQGVGNDRLVKEKDYRAKDCEEGTVFVIGLKIAFPEGLVLQRVGKSQGVPKEFIPGTCRARFLKNFPIDGLWQMESISLGGGQNEGIH